MKGEINIDNLEKIWISNLKISNKLKRNLINKFGGIREFYNCSLDDLVYFNVKDSDIDKILDLNLKKELYHHEKYMEKNNIGIISFEEKVYPNKLKNIEDFPIVLYYKGDINILEEDGIGIVGSRLAYKEILEQTKGIARDFSKLGINVISGLARGVDKFAHLGALEINFGKTIAVLGSGLDEKSFYPRENLRVFERIIENGGIVVSEYPLGTKPLSYNFPYRNRIISGLSNKIIIMQASIKSGSLITVDYALEQGKDIFVFRPEKSINSKNFEGNFELINQGAKIYESVEKLILN